MESECPEAGENDLIMELPLLNSVKLTADHFRSSCPFLAKDHRFKYVSIAPVLDWSCHDTEAKNADVRLLRAVLMRKHIMKVELAWRYQ